MPRTQKSFKGGLLNLSGPDNPLLHGSVEKPSEVGGTIGLKQKKPRKKRRRKAWKSDIRKYTTGKKATDMLTSKASFYRLVRDIMGRANPDMRITPSALESLRVSSEEAILEVMQRANLLARVCGGREGPLKRDWRVAVETLKERGIESSK